MEPQLWMSVSATPQTDSSSASVRCHRLPPPLLRWTWEGHPPLLTPEWRRVRRRRNKRTKTEEWCTQQGEFYLLSVAWKTKTKKFFRFQVHCAAPGEARLHRGPVRPLPRESDRPCYAGKEQGEREGRTNFRRCLAAEGGRQCPSRDQRGDLTSEKKQFCT